MNVRVILMITLCILFFSTFSSSYERLHGDKLILVGSHSPPYVFLERQQDGNVTFIGTYRNIWTWLSVKLNMTFDFMILVDGDPLVSKLGIYEAALFKVVNKFIEDIFKVVVFYFGHRDKEADGLTGILSVTPERRKIIDHTNFIMWTEPYTLIVPKPKQESRLFAFIRPFYPEVWIILVITMTGFIVTMSLFSWLYEKRLTDSNLDEQGKTQNYKREKKFINFMSFYMIYVMDTLTNHGGFVIYQQYSFRILTGCWLLATLVLVNSYSSLVVSSLTVPTTKPAVDSFEDLLNNKEVSLVLRKDIILGQQILNAKEGTLKILADEIRQHPDRLFIDVDSLTKKLEFGRYAFPFVPSFNRNIIVKDFRKDSVCRFQMSRPLPMMNPLFFSILQKNSRYTPAISIGLMYLWETGLTRLWIKQGISDRDECVYQKQKSRTNSAQKAAIKLEDLFSAFLILGIGVGLSLISFLLELITGVRSLNQ